MTVMESESGVREGKVGSVIAIGLGVTRQVRYPFPDRVNHATRSLRNKRTMEVQMHASCGLDKVYYSRRENKGVIEEQSWMKTWHPRSFAEPTSSAFRLAGSQQLNIRNHHRFA
jgi:hypothetical protein